MAGSSSDVSANPQSADSLINIGIPGGGGPDDNTKLFGVPDNYNFVPDPVRSGRSTPPGHSPQMVQGPTVAAHYKDGDQDVGGTWSPEKRATIQRLMDTAGLYQGNSYRYGRWDAESASAYKQVLEYANMNGLDDLTALNELASNPPKKAVTPKAGTVTALTPAVTLEQSIQSSAEKRLGRRLRSSEVARFVTVYHGLEHGDNAAQSAAQDAAAPDASQSTTAPDGTVTPANGASTELMPNTPAPGAAADGFIDSQYGQEAAGQSVAGYYDVIKNLIGGQ